MKKLIRIKYGRILLSWTKDLTFNNYHSFVHLLMKMNDASINTQNSKFVNQNFFEY